jgi:hypothetical protein
MPPPKGHEPYNKNGEGGRPRKYSTEDIERFADELLVWIKCESHFWIKDFCLERSIDPNYMHEWAKENERFRCAYDLSKSFQESRIFKGAMIDNFNSGMSKFALINNHGWADKTEAKISGDGVNPLAFLLQKADGQSKDLVNEQ